MNAPINASETISQLLAGTYRGSEDSKPLSVPTRAVEIHPTLDGMEADLVAGLGFAGTLAVVSDPNTHRVLGQRVEAALASRFTVKSIRFDHPPHADMETVEKLRGEVNSAEGGGPDAYIAVGSGTINDLCKYAAAQDNRRYAVFATALSMNGYTSTNAAITVDGHKMSLMAGGAAGVVMDLAVLSNAPPAMMVSGLGDSLARPSAQVDWLLSHRLFDTPYMSAPFDILRADEEALFTDPQSLAAGDAEATARLARTLTLSGFGMTVADTSAPASQAEHLISHFMDMCPPHVFCGDYPGVWPGAAHGNQVAVASISMTRLQHHLLAGPVPVLRPTMIDQASLTQAFGAALGVSCAEATAKKAVLAEAVDALNQRLSDQWADICAELSAIMWPTSVLENAMTVLGGPTRPEDLGLSRDYYNAALSMARFIRDRYTFLDLAGDSGALTPELVAGL